MSSATTSYTIGALQRRERGWGGTIRPIGLRLSLELRRMDGVEGEGGGRETAGLESAAVISRAIIVESLADDLAALDDDGAMTEAQRGLGGLVEAEVEVQISLHFA